MALIPCLGILTKKEVICRIESYYIPAMASTAQAFRETYPQKSTNIEEPFPLLLSFSQNQTLKWHVSSSNTQKKIFLPEALDFHSFPRSFTLFIHPSSLQK